jgi:ATP-dependent Lon protease
MANQKDIQDIPDEFRQKIKFMFVENLDEVFALAFDRKSKKISKGAKHGKKDKLPRVASGSSTAA